MEQAKIFYKIVESPSSNQWMIMVHGFTQNHQVFTRQVEYLKDYTNILLVDLRGHGSSPDGLGAYGIEEYADDLESLVEHLKIRRFHYFATHTGTAIGLVLYFRHPRWFESLVLEGTVLPDYPMPRVRYLINQARNVYKNYDKEACIHTWFNISDWFDSIREHPKQYRSHEHLKILKAFRCEPFQSDLIPKQVTNVTDRLDQIDVECMIYNGSNDMMDFVHVADLMTSKVANIKRYVIDDTGGFPLWEKPNDVNALIKKELFE